MVIGCGVLKLGDQKFNRFVPKSEGFQRIMWYLLKLGLIFLDKCFQTWLTYHKSTNNENYTFIEKNLPRINYQDMNSTKTDL